jgi:Uma2 family endonuclease
MPGPTATRFSVDDYLSLPDDGKRYQVIAGDLVMTPAPETKHQIVLMRLARILADFLEENDLGQILIAPCDVVLSPEDVVQPDIFFVSAERKHIVGEKNVIGAPDLVIEVLSPSTEEWDRRAKMAVYSRSRVKESWIVDPDSECIEMRVLQKNAWKRARIFGKKEVLTTSLLPGCRVPIAKIFP